MNKGPTLPDFLKSISEILIAYKYRYKVGNLEFCFHLASEVHKLLTAVDICKQFKIFIGRRVATRP